MECQTCGGKIMAVTITKEKVGSKGKLVVHNIPAERCECDTKIAFRPLLIIDDYIQTMSKDIEFIEYEVLEKKYSSIQTQDLIM